MSENTSIEWCDHSWSPWRGCTKVSPGCANCYAEDLSKRFGISWGEWGKGKQRVISKNWREPTRWNIFPPPDHVLNKDGQRVLTSARKPTVFPSLCDWLDDEVPIEWFVRFLGIIKDTPNLDWLLLTKRPENFRSRIEAAMEPAGWIGRSKFCADWVNGTPPPNVWIGTSVEDQLRANERIPELLRIPAKLRFLSVEPLLGPIEFSDVTGRSDWLQELGRKALSGIDWVIIGGESGPKSRRSNVEWIRSIVRQCKTAGVRCFVKQLGAFVTDRNDRGFEGDSGPLGWPMDTSTDDCVAPGTFQGKPVRILTRHPKGGDPAEWPEDLRVRQIPEVKP